jgi:hypothetical protein
MNYVEILKLTQLKTLLKIFQSSCIQSLKIFGARQGFLFEFASSSGVWKFENYLTELGPHVSSLFPFDRPGRSFCPTRHPVPGGRDHCAESTRHWWPPVVTAPRGLAPLITAPDVTVEAIADSTFPLPPFSHAPRCSTPRWPPLHLSSPRPSCTKNLPTAPASDSGQRDSPAVIFVREHLIGGSLLRLFPQPANPAASSAPPKSSSPTTSSATSTTRSAPYRRLLPIGTRAAAEAPPLMSTHFLASPPRFSYSGMWAEVQ